MGFCGGDRDIGEWFVLSSEHGFLEHIAFVLLLTKWQLRGVFVIHETPIRVLERLVDGQRQFSCFVFFA